MNIPVADANPSSPSTGQRPLRVLLVVEPGVDGVFRYVEGLLRRLMERDDIEPGLAYSSLRGSLGLTELVALAEKQGVRTLDLRVNNLPALGDISAFARLWRLAREFRPDVIHAHSSKAGVLARCLAFLGIRARYFYTPHAYFEMYGVPSVKRRAFQHVERVLGRVGTTINVSHSEGEYARAELGLPVARQTVLINGVDCDRFHPATDLAEKKAAREKFDLPSDGLLLGTVARYTEQKDPATLYEAVLAAMRVRPGLHFAHLGRGDLWTKIDVLIATQPEEVRARVHRREVSEEPAVFYRALDGFVLPSRYEGFALAAIEALASGLPVILSDCPGNTDLKGYGLDTVYWVQPEDPVTLRREILGWTDSVVTPANHRRVAVERLNSEVTYNQVIACYTAARSVAR